MLYFVIPVIVLLAIGLSLRLRVRFLFGGDDQLFFVGLGRTGIEIDLSERSGRVKIWGLGVKKLSLEKRATKSQDVRRTKETKVAQKPKRTRDWRAAARLLPQTAATLFKYVIELIRSSIVEELRADIKGGFESPDLTGRAFGYYQAVLAAAPGVVGRVHFQPDWTGPSFSASARGSFALPMYKLLYHTARTLRALALRDLIKLAIGTKRGGQDG